MVRHTVAKYVAISLPFRMVIFKIKSRIKLLQNIG